MKSETTSAGLQAASVLTAVVGLDLVLNLAFSGTALRGSLPLGARLTAVSLDVLGAAAVVAAAFVVVVVARALARALSFESRVVAVTFRALGYLTAWTMVTLFVTSWGMYGVVGRFLDREGIDFWLVQPIQLFYWVDPRLFAALCAAAVALSWLLTHFIPRVAVRLGAAGRRRMVSTTVLLVLVAASATLFAELTRAAKPSPFAPDPPEVAARNQHAGPFAHIVGELGRGLPAGLLASSRIGVTRRPLTTMAAYVAANDPSSIHRWNVIVVVVESLRADQLRAYASTREVMSTLDRLALESRVFTNAYTQASHSSYASPVPFSSQYPLRSRSVYSYPAELPYPHVMLYDVLKALGYRTAIFSSQNEYWQGMINYLQTPGLDRFFHPEVFDGVTTTPEGDVGFAQWVKDTKHAGSVDDRDTVKNAIEWLDQSAEAFFLGLNLQNSHLPYVVPSDFPHRFGPAQIDFSLQFGMWPRRLAPVVKDLYADSLVYVDAQIERLVAHLRERGMLDRTIMVFTGDHGQAFYEHGFSAHAGAVYDEVMRVPLVIRAPDLDPGIDVRPAQHVDIAPTILDLIGLTPHPAFQGASLVTPTFDAQRSVYMVAQTPLAHQYALVRGPYKLIYDESDKRHLLFNTVNDPGEIADLTERRPELVEAMTERLFTWREAQIDYYADSRRYLHEYPPVLDD